MPLEIAMHPLVTQVHSCKGIKLKIFLHKYYILFMAKKKTVHILLILYLNEDIYDISKTFTNLHRKSTRIC